MQSKLTCTLAEQKHRSVKSSQSQSKKVHKRDHNHTKPEKRGNLTHLGPSASRQKFKTPGPNMMISISTQTRSPQPTGRSARPKQVTQFNELSSSLGVLSSGLGSSLQNWCMGGSSFCIHVFLMVVFHRPFSSSRLAHGNLCLRCTKGGKKIWLELGCALGPQVAEERLTWRVSISEKQLQLEGDPSIPLHKKYLFHCPLEPCTIPITGWQLIAERGQHRY